MKPITLSGFVRLLNPLFLVGGVLLYALGVGIAHYLGVSINWQIYLLGQACVTLLQLNSLFLKEYFETLTIPPVQGRLPADQEGDSSSVQEHLTRPQALLLATTILTVGAVLTVLLIQSGSMSPQAYLILGAAFLISFFYAAPPLRLVSSGYGELALAILLANLVPALGFLLQAHEFHRLLGMLTFPLTPLFLAMMFAKRFPDYASDLKYKQRTLLVRLGWKNGMILHNLLILFGFLLLGIFTLLGLAWQIAWPALLVLPIGLFQIWQMYQIAEGVKPRWRLLVTTAVATFGLAAYLLAYALWTG